MHLRTTELSQKPLVLLDTISVSSRILIRLHLHMFQLTTPCNWGVAIFTDPKVGIEVVAVHDIMATVAEISHVAMSLILHLQHPALPTLFVLIAAKKGTCNQVARRRELVVLLTCRHFRPRDEEKEEEDSRKTAEGRTNEGCCRPSYQN